MYPYSWQELRILNKQQMHEWHFNFLVRFDDCGRHREGRRLLKHFIGFRAEGTRSLLQHQSLISFASSCPPSPSSGSINISSAWNSTSLLEPKAARESSRASSKYSNWSTKTEPWTKLKCRDITSSLNELLCPVTSPPVTSKTAPLPALYGYHPPLPSPSR